MTSASQRPSSSWSNSTLRTPSLMGVSLARHRLTLRSSLPQFRKCELRTHLEPCATIRQVRAGSTRLYDDGTALGVVGAKQERDTLTGVEVESEKLLGRPARTC